MFSFLILLCIIVIFVYIYLICTYQHWNERNIIGPLPKIVNGNTPNFLFWRKNIVLDFNDIYQKFRGNPIVGVFVLRTPALIALSPEIVKQVMIEKFKNFRNNDISLAIDQKSDPFFGLNPFALKDETWKLKRSQITPAFTTFRIKALKPLVDSVAFELITFLKEKLNRRPTESLNILNIAEKYTVNVLSSCIFSCNARAFKDEESKIPEMSRRLMKPVHAVYRYFMITSFLPFFCFWKTGITYKEVITFFTDLAVQATKIRLQDGSNQRDFLDYLKNLKVKANLNDGALAGHFMSIFWDGYETSSIAMSFVLYELSRNQTVQNKLRAEVLELNEFNYESLNGLSYLDKCIYEALRLNPPLALLTKICTEATDLVDIAGNTIKIEMGDAINIPVYSIHRDQDHYSNPKMFYPERFDEIDVKTCMDKCTLLTFGAGPRVCIGRKFALLQMKLFIINIVKNFNLSLDEKTEELTIRPDHFVNYPRKPILINFNGI